MTHETYEDIPCPDCEHATVWCETCQDYFHVSALVTCFLHRTTHDAVTA